jgi:hypothetical protein
MAEHTRLQVILNCTGSVMTIPRNIGTLGRNVPLGEYWDLL